MQKNLFKIIFFLFLLTVLFRCKPKEKIPPEFPPENQLTIDFSYFTEPISDVGNYAYAYRVAKPWIAFLNDSLQAYYDMINTVYGKSFNYQDDNTWLIEGTLNSGTKKYDIKYFEITDIDTIYTKLFFSQDTLYENLLLSDGSFIPDSTIGYRQINLPDTANTYKKFLRLDWSVATSEKREIRYTNTLTEGKNGNYIFYKDSTDEDFNVYFNFYDKSNENHSIIEYNTKNLNGRIKDLQYFGDENWHCWDAEKTDIDCSVEK